MSDICWIHGYMFLKIGFNYAALNIMMVAYGHRVKAAKEEGHIKPDWESYCDLGNDMEFSRSQNLL